MVLVQIHPWTIWLFWSSPLMYAMQAISVNEFTAGERRHLTCFPSPGWTFLVNI